MTTETPTVPGGTVREMLEDRWRQLMVRPTPFGDGTWTLDNSPDWYKLERVIGRLLRHTSRCDVADDTLGEYVSQIIDRLGEDIIRVIEEKELAS